MNLFRPLLRNQESLVSLPHWACSLWDSQDDLVHARLHRPPHLCDLKMPTLWARIGMPEKWAAFARTLIEKEKGHGRKQTFNMPSFMVTPCEIKLVVSSVDRHGCASDRGWSEHMASSPPREKQPGTPWEPGTGDPGAPVFGLGGRLCEPGCERKLCWGFSVPACRINSTENSNLC